MGCLITRREVPAGRLLGLGVVVGSLPAALQDSERPGAHRDCGNQPSCQMYRLVTTLCVLLLPGLLLAQSTGTCERGSAQADLDIGNVHARLYNTGGLFWKGAGNLYRVPKAGNAHAIFAHDLWIGGLVDGELRMAASDYGPWEFWPGPLDADGNPPADCAKYDRMYRISRPDLEAYERDGTLTDDLRDWPVHLGAGVVDGDGLPGNYNLEAGDRPELLGDQAVWWVMNDRGNTHDWSLTSPIGLELQVTAFAFGARPHQTPLDAVAEHSTFYRYRLVYKGESPWESAYFGLFNDPDLGDAGDDYVGSDSTLHMGYVWNGDNDDGSRGGYGSQPPALGNVILKGATIAPDGLDNDRDGETDEAAERQGMNSFVYYSSGGPIQGNPRNGNDAYRFLQGFWRDGRPITFGGSGAGFSDEPAKFMWPADPPAFWSEENTDDAGTRNQPADRRFVMASGPFHMESGDVQDILVGIVWARGYDRFDSVRQLKADVRGLHLVGSDELLRPRLPTPSMQKASTPERYLLYRTYPNPFRTGTTIRYDLPQEQLVNLTIFDVLGRPVQTLVATTQPAGSYEAHFDASGLAPGLYLARLRLGHLERSLTIIKQP